MITRYTPDEWAAYSEIAHSSVFNEKKPAFFDRISYALVVSDNKTKRPMGYLTVRENDHESVYWQFGGAFKEYRGSVGAVRGYDEFIQYQRQFSKRIGTYIENTNTPMLKMALTFGFLIIGTRSVFAKTYCDLLLEFE